MCPVMIRWLGILIGTLRSTVRTHRELALENLALRQQLAVWKARPAATAQGYGPDLLGGVVEALEELAEFAADGAARDRGRLAPAGVQALLGVEESTPTRSACDQDGAPRSDSADEPRQSSLGCAEDSRRAAEAGPDSIAGDRRWMGQPPLTAGHRVPRRGEPRPQGPAEGATHPVGRRESWTNNWKAQAARTCSREACRRSSSSCPNAQPSGITSICAVIAPRAPGASRTACGPTFAVSTQTKPRQPSSPISRMARARSRPGFHTTVV